MKAMELLLTSFGLWPQELQEGTELTDIFHRMPPVSMKNFAGRHFSAEYSVLLFCDKIVIDTATFDRLKGNPHPLYREVASMVRTLFQEGYVRVVDFDSILNENRSLLGEMLALDRGNIRSWVSPLTESAKIWFRFASQVSATLNASTLYLPDRIETPIDDDHLLFGNLPYYAWGQEAIGMQWHVLCHTTDFKDWESVIESYLNYVNANLVLSAELDIPFHDWADFSPFYETKFKLVGQRSRRGVDELSKMEQLFEVAFPSFAIQDVRTLLRILKDNRIQELRALVSEAARGGTDFDQEFANRVISEVLKVELELVRIRKVISYLTMPLSLIPYAGTVIQKGVEETASSLAERRLRKPHRWFYLISDVTRR